MFIVVSPLNPDPMYKQVTDQIKQAIAGGELKPEEKLPSIREMAHELNISVITIKRAYADLENEGYIFTRPGMGSFVAHISPASLRREKLAEYRRELAGMLAGGEKYGIAVTDLMAILEELKGE